MKLTLKAWLAAWLVCFTLVDSSFAGDVWPGPPPRITPTPAEMEDLHDGNILVESTRTDEAGGAARARVLFQVDVETLWQVLGDCEANYRFVRGLKDCEIVTEDRETAVTRQSLKPYRLMPRFDYRFETLREPYNWIRIRLLDGDLRALDGSWRFDVLPEGAGVLVTHEIRVQPGIMVPRWLARRTVQRDLVNMLACLRWETRAWPEPRQRGLDREQCP